MEQKQVLIGMSGGVDSAAAAVLLRQAGYTPVGCTLRLCPESEEQAVEDARAAAQRLGMAFVTADCTADFRRRVMDSFVADYRDGRTPNPCVQCNRYVKFDGMLRQADSLGIPYIATGHYARRGFDQGTGCWQLLRGKDRRKDQTYFLYVLTQAQLSRLLLPVGDFDKEEIRALAAEAGLVNAHKPDSQDICFIPDGDYGAFLRQYGGVEPVPGDFVDQAGNILGRHRGQELYTTGQRRGLGVSAGRPLYVVRKTGNTVVLGDEADLYSSRVWASGFNWVSLPPQRGPVEVTVKTRYSQDEVAAVLYPQADGIVRAELREPRRAVTPGQALVAYQGDVVVGGGEICCAE